MNSAAKNSLIAIMKTNFICWHQKYFKTCVLLWRFLRSFSSYNSKTNAVRKILIPDLESASKNTSIKRKIIYFGICALSKILPFFFPQTQNVNQLSYSIIWYHFPTEVIVVT